MTILSEFLWLDGFRKRGSNCLPGNCLEEQKPYAEVCPLSSCVTLGLRCDTKTRFNAGDRVG
jgi:hypothetical protein